MLIIGLDGYDFSLIKNIQWKKRFNYFSSLTTYFHTIPSNYSVCTGRTDFEYLNKPPPHKYLDLLPKPCLWHKLKRYFNKQIWIGFPLFDHIPTEKDFLGVEVKNKNRGMAGEAILFGAWETEGKLVYPMDLLKKECIKKYFSIMSKSRFKQIDELRELTHLIFEIYDLFKENEFIFLYVFFLDPANHIGKTHIIKSIIDNYLSKIKLHNQTLIYSDHGIPQGGTTGKWARHRESGIIGIKSSKINKITHISQVYNTILEMAKHEKNRKELQ